MGRLMSCLLNATSTKESKNPCHYPQCDCFINCTNTSYMCFGEKLSEDECWRILKYKAFPDASAVLSEDQEKIGREIAKKCAGVPLVAKVLGNMMRSKDFDGWRSLVESRIWDLPEGEERILSVLKLSFDELKPPSLKQCFAYCSMFVKDFQIRKCDLINLWMAQGLLYPSPPNRRNLEMEDIKALPKSIGKLYNLQTLRMSRVKLEEYPKELQNLINLRHVYFDWDVMKFPAGMGRLTNLRTLVFFIVGKETGPGIEELASLNLLRGKLSIYNLEHVRDGEEAKKAKLVEKTNIRQLSLDGRRTGQASPMMRRY
ncbi:unnamed protein product [Prunus armeniaca]|uniref:Disease resistance R13L4/SHOC-2-like LRR domain-containing protein n=1 Tax=Prunus armeniaca TaxID=36596 RepID=A0A6J5WHZ0_PRUAR|nr:unnamed protein product [Prunus armeniaca]